MSTRTFSTCMVFAATIFAAACGSNTQVRTQIAPNANFASRHTFRILEAHRRGPEASPSNIDPMLNGSMTYQALRDAIRTDFESRGYRYDPQSADFDVAYYAVAREKVDWEMWDWGYRWRPWPLNETPVAYTEGTLIINVIDPVSKDMLWHGSARAVVSDNPDTYTMELTKAASTTINRFPAASPTATAQNGGR
jgi:hypothetical protein